MIAATKRVIGYIDGFNLYFGLREKGWKWAYWLNLQALMGLYIKPGQALIDTKYFTSIISSPPDKHDRQLAFLEALQTLNNLSIFYGHYLSKPYVCYQCKHTHTEFSEKMTDVNIATQLLVDGFQNRFDTALLVSADSDLTPPIQAIHQLFPGKRVIVLFPPGRSSKSLMRAADGYSFIGADKLSKSLFPEQVTKPDGYILRHPGSWH